MNLVFSASDIETCLRKAAKALNIDKENLKYKMIKEEKKFFRKKITIEIDGEYSLVDNNYINGLQKKITTGAEVKNGIISVKKLDDEDELITIKSCDGVDLFWNGKKTDIIKGAKESDEIKYIIKEYPQPSRAIKISVSKDKMEAYITTQSIPQNIYKLEDSGPSKNLILKKVLFEQKYAPKFTPDEINNELHKKDIIFGILNEKVKEVCNEDEVSNTLIAKGIQVVDDIPEEIEILFKDYDKLKEISDTEERIDYRNRIFLAIVKAGDEIANIIPAKEGKDGKNVFGEIVKRKDVSKVKFKVGEGCKYENNKIISMIEGNPSFKYNIFKVHQVYNVDEVNLITGNINFVADVKVTKKVAEGMEVISGNSVFVGENVESAKIKAASDIRIKGNILNSTIIAGEKSINNKKYLLNLNYVINVIDYLYSDVVQVKKNNLLEIRSTGEIIKILIENKYKTLVPLCIQILDICKIKGIKDSSVIMFINKKIIGFGPLTIDDEKELLEFLNLLKEEVNEFEEFEENESNIYLEYVQGSKIEAMGSVIIQGKGQYTSEITALIDIEFTSENSVCRGGILSAGKEIKLKTVGSEAGVKTILKVPKDGVIMADIAYSNTVFCFGEKQIVLDVASRNVKAYLDSLGDITIEKLLL